MPMLQDIELDLTRAVLDHPSLNPMSMNLLSLNSLSLNSLTSNSGQVTTTSTISTDRILLSTLKACDGYTNAANHNRNSETSKTGQRQMNTSSKSETLTVRFRIATTPLLHAVLKALQRFLVYRAGIIAMGKDLRTLVIELSIERPSSTYFGGAYDAQVLKMLFDICQAQSLTPTASMDLIVRVERLWMGNQDPGCLRMLSGHMPLAALQGLRKLDIDIVTYRDVTVLDLTSVPEETAIELSLNAPKASHLIHVQFAHKVRTLHVQPFTLSRACASWFGTELFCRNDACLRNVHCYSAFDLDVVLDVLDRAHRCSSIVIEHMLEVVVHCNECCANSLHIMHTLFDYNDRLGWVRVRLRSRSVHVFVVTKLISRFLAGNGTNGTSGNNGNTNHRETDLVCELAAETPPSPLADRHALSALCDQSAEMLASWLINAYGDHAFFWLLTAGQKNTGVPRERE